MSLLKKACFLGATIGAAGVLFWLLSPRTGNSPDNAEPQSSMLGTPSSSPAEASGSQSPDVIDPALANATETNSELEATHRMYMAHASLREPEVVDPDSEPNRLILETMVKKALLQDAPAN